MSTPSPRTDEEEVELGEIDAVPHSTDEHGMISNHNSKEEERQKKRKLKLAIIGIICAFAAIIVIVAIAEIMERRGGGVVEPPVAPPFEKPVKYGDAARNVLAAMNKAADPCNDWVNYACGGWMAANEIPADQARWGMFTELAKKNREMVKDILEDNWPLLSPFWKSCTDTTTIDTLGLTAVKPLLDEIDNYYQGVDTLPQDLANIVASLHRSSVDIFFRFGVDVDAYNPDLTVVNFQQGGITLPTRGFYFEDSKAALRESYKSHIASMLQLAGETDSTTKAMLIYNIELAIAKFSWDDVEFRDPVKIYNVWDLDLLEAATTGRFSWAGYFNKLRVPTSVLNHTIVAQPDYMTNLTSIFGPATADLAEGLRLYMKYRLLHSKSAVLSQEFRDLSFGYRKLIYNVQAPTPRDTFCASTADSLIGQLVGRVFVLKHFPDLAATRAHELIDRLEEAFEHIINSVGWMDAATKVKAINKLKKIINKIGYPEHWPDYSNLLFHKETFLQNVIDATHHNFDSYISWLGKAAPRDVWFMTPSTVNAYFNPGWSEIVFPAGILQPPFFSADFPDAMNYGGIGSVIGHELSHGFDDSGRQYDAKGSLTPWWPQPVVDAFNAQAKCMIDQYSAITLVESQATVNGLLTLGENIADNGGVREAYSAFQAQMNSMDKHDREDEIDTIEERFGMSPEQLFFVSFAQIWCEKSRPEYVQLLVKSDPHSPGSVRAKVPLQNFPKFAEAFRCHAGSDMNPSHRCTVW